MGTATTSAFPGTGARAAFPGRAGLQFFPNVPPDTPAPVTVRSRPAPRARS